MSVVPINELRGIIKRDEEAGWYSGHVIRKVSIYFTWAFLHTNITANQTTYLMLVVGILGSILIGTGNLAAAVFGVILLQFSYVLDHVDGEIARYRKQSSLNGILLDAITHEVLTPLMFAAAGMFLYRGTGSIGILVLSFAAAWASMGPIRHAKMFTLHSLL